jgi:molybdopterin synthase sulfur carrier subunit
MTTVYLPTPLRSLNGNQARVQLQATTFPELLAALDAACPGIHDRLYDSAGAFKRYINVFLNDQDIRYVETGQIKLAERDEVSIIPAMAGG